MSSYYATLWTRHMIFPLDLRMLECPLCVCAPLPLICTTCHSFFSRRQDLFLFLSEQKKKKTPITQKEILHHPVCWFDRKHTQKKKRQKEGRERQMNCNQHARHACLMWPEVLLQPVEESPRFKLVPFAFSRYWRSPEWWCKTCHKVSRLAITINVTCYMWFLAAWKRQVDLAYVT